MTDELWEIIEPLLPPELPKPRGARPAEVARLVAGGCMAQAAPGAVGPAGPSRGDRLGTRFFGLGERSRQKGGQRTGPNPTDKGKAGSKRHVVSDRGGVPLAVILTAANVHDSNVFEELVEAVEPSKRPRGRPRKRPKKLHADKGYDAKKWREALRGRGIKSRIAPEAGSRAASGWEGTGGLYRADAGVGGDR